MKLTSPAFENDGKIPSKYTCDGADIITPLKIEDVPEDAESLVLIMDDPDAVEPAGKVWDHWVVFNLNPSTTDIKEGQPPAATYGQNSWSRNDWGGPCPPDKEHTYHFKLYALDTKLDLPAGSTKKEIESAMKDHVIEKTELLGRYERK